MSDYTTTLVVPTHIHSASKYMVGATLHEACSAALGTSFAWTANVAIYIPLVLPWPYNVRRLFWVNGAVAGGNSDIGIYTPQGTLIYSKGPTACSGSALPQYVTPATDILLGPGAYLLAWSNDGTTNRAYGTAGATATATAGRAVGCYQQSSAATLPSPATFAAYAAAGVPYIGITNTDSGF